MERRSESELVRRVVAGEEEAFRDLLERHRETLRVYAERWMPQGLRRRVSPSDVLQETCLVVWARIREFEPRGENAFRNFLLRVLELKTKEAVRTHLVTKKRSARREVTRGERPDTGQFRDAADSPSALAADREHRLLLANAVRELAPDHRTVFELVHTENLTLAEAAERMGRSREATKKLHARAVASLGRILQGRPEDSAPDRDEP